MAVDDSEEQETDVQERIGEYIRNTEYMKQVRQDMERRQAEQKAEAEQAAEQAAKRRAELLAERQRKPIEERVTEIEARLDRIESAFTTLRGRSFRQYGGEPKGRLDSIEKILQTWQQIFK